MKRKSRDANIVQAFNPLDKKNLGESVAEALLQQPISPLPPEPFIGAGIYAIYYEGKFTLVNHRLNRATDIRRNEASDRGLKGGFGPLIHSADFTSFRERVLCSLTGGVTVLGCARASR